MSDEGTTTRGRSRAASTKTRQAKAPPVDPLLQLLGAMQGVNAGDFSVQVPLHWDGIEGKLAASGPPEALMTEALIATIFDVEATIIIDPVHQRPLCIPLRTTARSVG